MINQGTMIEYGQRKNQQVSRFNYQLILVQSHIDSIIDLGAGNCAKAARLLAQLRDEPADASAETAG